MKNERLSANFGTAEFACHSGEEIPDAIIPNLRRLCLTVLQPLRDQWVGPLIIISGWRSATWNKQIAGAEHSRHMSGEAADIRPVFIDLLPRFQSMVERLILNGGLAGLGGYGTYPNWLHVDCRPKPPGGHVARWDGRGIGSEK